MKNTTISNLFDVLSGKMISRSLAKNTISTLGFRMPNLSFFRPKSLNSTHIRCFDYYGLLNLLGEKSFFSFKNVFVFLIVSCFGFSSAFAQALPNEKRCTSKDLELVEAVLTGGNACNSCTEGATETRTLTLSINNTTGSNRTSFAFWGTLNRYVDGVLVGDPESISGCNSTPLAGNTSALPPNTLTSLNFGNVTYVCGQRLVITNLYLAWTSATDNASCPLDPSKIAPKCGIRPSIEINAGVNGSVTSVAATCTADGSITVRPFGGVPPYKVKLGNGTPYDVAADGSKVFSPLAANSYTVTITDSAVPACSVTKTETVGGPSPIAKPEATVDQPTCTITKGTVKVKSPVSSAICTLKQSGELKYTADSDGVFSEVAPGIYDLVATIGSCSATGDPLTVNSPPAIPDAPTFCVMLPSLCDVTKKGSLTILTPIGAAEVYQYSIDNGTNWQASLVFNGLNPGAITGVKVKTVSTGCISDAANCDESNICPPPSSNRIVETAKAVAPIEAKTESAGFDAYPVPFKDQLTIKYKFDYVSDAKIEVFNSQGILVLSKTDANSYLNKEIALDLKLNKGKEQVYVVKVTTNRGSSTKKVMASE